MLMNSAYIMSDIVSNKLTMSPILGAEELPSKNQALITMDVPSSPVCQLLRLPGELRNAIYHLVLDLNGRIYINRSQPEDDDISFYPYHYQPALARTCRHLRSEVLSVFYGESTLVVDYTSDYRKTINHWATLLRPSQQYFRRIEFTAGFTCTERDRPGKFERVITVSPTEDGCIKVSATGSGCVCRFERCARDVERGVIGDKEDSPLIRFLKAWDVPPLPAQTALSYGCMGCSGTEADSRVDSIVRSLARKGNEVTVHRGARPPKLVLGVSK